MMYKYRLLLSAAVIVGANPALSHLSLDDFEMVGDSNSNSSKASEKDSLGASSLKSSLLDDLRDPIEDLVNSFTDLGDVKSTERELLFKDFVKVSSNAGTSLSDSVLDSTSAYTTVQSSVKMDPLVSGDQELKLNQKFVENVPTYGKFADLSYHLVKGRVAISNDLLEKYMNAGWKIKGFHGLSGSMSVGEGFDGQNHDLAGFVAYHPKTGEAVVALHGSQDGDDWVNNLDGQVIASREIGLKFHGGVHKGFSDRFQSYKKELDEIVSTIYKGLSQEEQDKFHITVTGHSLGGAMTVLTFADLATDLSKQLFGANYNNAEQNRVRAYAISPPRVFNDHAAEELGRLAGQHNIIIDTNDYDPVSMGGPGASITKWLENSSAYGPTRLFFAAAKNLTGKVTISHPQAIAMKYGAFAHFGTKAYQDKNVALARAAALPIEVRDGGKGWLDWLKNNAEYYLQSGLAPYHYGRLQAHGLAFEPKLLEPETLETRINASRKVKDIVIDAVEAASTPVESQDVVIDIAPEVAPASVSAPVVSTPAASSGWGFGALTNAVKNTFSGWFGS